MKQQQKWLQGIITLHRFFLHETTFHLKRWAGVKTRVCCNAGGPRSSNLSNLAAHHTGKQTKPPTAGLQATSESRSYTLACSSLLVNAACNERGCLVNSRSAARRPRRSLLSSLFDSQNIRPHTKKNSWASCWLQTHECFFFHDNQEHLKTSKTNKKKKTFNVRSQELYLRVRMCVADVEIRFKDRNWT